MSKAIQFFVYIATAISLLQGWLFVAALFGIWFSLHASSAWLILLGVLVDGYFGAWYSIPYITIIAVVWYMVIELARPHILWQNTSENNA